jgi:hypothetical protein
MLGAFDASTSRDWPIAGRPTNPDWDDNYQLLPLEAAIERSPRGWVIRLPVRAEELVVEKQWVVAEEVVVRTRPVEEVVEVDETVRREELKIEADDTLDVTRPTPVGQFGDFEERSREAAWDRPWRPARERAEDEEISSEAAHPPTGSAWVRSRPPAFRRPRAPNQPR